ncbi:FH2 domain-containing protein 1-like isoform X1 [Girardinichthys multiradiatus]|uniref:FH2 domain-containing protein 1-like isoform X1 n=2 Tax=Girardinichthys multiradiatus TaxID=208333 RepID=UPI001FAC693F|nr:FH2 domain-containing protein 1-like isoform X1 [Girardinichthys multiradiatus]
MHVMGSVSPANNIEGLSFHEDVAVAEAMSPPSSLRFSHNSKNGTNLPDNPPPPPAPLPPPPPPPPLLPTGLAGNPGGLKKKKRVRSFFWKTIPAEKVKGRANLWTQGHVEQNFQIDVQKIEELFTQNDGPPASTTIRGGRARVSLESKDEVSILDAKRGLNIAIFLKQFKKSNQTLVDDIHHGNSESFGTEPLRELLKLLPEKEEAKKLKAYRGDVSKLSLADSFVYLLTQMPSYSVRIESMLLKEEFPGACEAMKRDLKILRSATKELMCCKELHAVLHLVLQAGNILNAGGSAGNAVGFKLSSLLSLADTKANKPGMNLMHFVALEAQKKDEKLLEFPLKLSAIQAASRISMETLDAELQLLTSRTRSVEESIQKDTELLQQLDSFLQSATSSLCSLRGSQQQLKKEGRELIDFFCEDRDTFRLDDCFSIFQTFCTRFTNAVKENKERETKEAACRQRIHDEELKRHSWSGGEEVTGAFRWRCSSETDMSAAASRDEAGLLLDLLTPKSQTSPSLNASLVARGRSGNLQRSRNSPTSSPSVAAQRELSALLEMSNELRVPRQRVKENMRKPLPPASPKLEPQSFGLSPMKVSVFSQVVSQTHLETSSSRNPENTNHMKSSYLSTDDVHKDMNRVNDKDKVKSTSDSKQQSKLINVWNNRAVPSFSSQEKLPNNPPESGFRNKTEDRTSSRQSDESSSTAAKGNMSVLLEKCTLVPELQVFDKANTRTGRDEVRCTNHRHDNAVTTGLEEEGEDNVQNNSKEIEKKSSLAQKQNIEEQEVKVIVWCVTGVCEAAGENVHSHTETDQYEGKRLGETQQTSSATVTHECSEGQLDGRTTESVPISSQPVPVSRCTDPSLPISSPGLHPIKSPSATPEPTTNSEPAPPSLEPPSASLEPALTHADLASATPDPTVTAEASRQDKKTGNPVTEAGNSTNQKTDVTPSSEQTSDHGSINKKTSRQSTVEGSSTGGKTKPEPSTKQSTKKFLNSKTGSTGTKPSNTTSTGSRSIRTLYSSENQSTSRVVHITKINPGSSSRDKKPEKPPAYIRSSSRTTSHTGLNISNVNSSSIRRGERPTTAPSSHRSGTTRTPESKELREPKVSGREQNQDLQGRPSIRKPLMKPRTQTEEKMCLSKLRALNQVGGGRSVSAPVTPLHKSRTPSSSVLPGFTRSTASSSFRRTKPPPVAASHPPDTGSPKSSPKTFSSSAPSAAPSSSFSQPAIFSSRSTDILNMSSRSPLRRSQISRSSAPSPLHSSLAPPKGHRRNDSGSFSDTSTQFKDWNKASRPSWR